MNLKTSRRCAPLLLALLPMLDGCSGQDAPESAMRAAQATQRVIATLPPECTLSAPGLEANGTWLNTAKAVPGTGPGIVNVFSFDKTVTTRALRVALDRQGLRDLDKVETRDAQGKWIDAGPTARRDAPAACDYVWLEQELPETRQVDALRFSFRKKMGTITAANAGVLQESGAR